MSSRLVGRQSQTENLNHQIIVSAAIGMSIAACTTVLRVGLRIRRLWWDDAFAIAGLSLLIITAVTGKLYFSIDEDSKIPQGSRVALYYIFAVTFDMTIWASRLSVMFSIIRLRAYLRQLYIATALFALAVLILVAQVFWVCEPQNRQTHWKESPIPQCVLGRSVAITQVTTDAFADIILVASPLLIFRHLKSAEAQAQKVRLSAWFAVGGLTTLVSIIHAVYLLRGTDVSIVVGNAELSISVIICNFAVLAAAVHRVWSKYHPEPKKQDPQHSTIHFESPARPTNSQGETLGSGISSEAPAINETTFKSGNTGTTKFGRGSEQQALKEIAV